MAFYTAILKQVNGFDPQFRKAGDDVDVIWRIQNAGPVDRVLRRRRRFGTIGGTRSRRI